jgi:hypothetical protein
LNYNFADYESNRVCLDFNLLKIRISLFFYTFFLSGCTAGTNPMLFLQALGGIAFIGFIEFVAL